MDSSWASARDWSDRLDRAGLLLDEQGAVRIGGLPQGARVAVAARGPGLLRSRAVEAELSDEPARALVPEDPQTGRICYGDPDVFSASIGAGGAVAVPE